MAEQTAEPEASRTTSARSGVIGGILWLLGCQLVGQLIADLLRIPVPAPVIGMVLLFLSLQWQRPAENDSTLRVADFLLRHLQLLFVPAGVGVVVYLRTIAHHAGPIVAAMAVSWTVGLAVVGWTAVALSRWRSR